MFFLLSEIDQAKWLCEQPACFADFREWLRDDSTHWTMEDLVQDSPTWKEVNFATTMRGTMQLHQQNLISCVKNLALKQVIQSMSCMCKFLHTGVQSQEDRQLYFGLSIRVLKQL